MHALHRRSWIAALLVVGSLMAAGAAKAVPVAVPPGGFTLIQLTNPLAFATLDAAIIAPGEGPQTLFGEIFVRFPVIAVDVPAGIVAHSGGFSIAGGSVTLTNPILDLGAKRVFVEVNNSGTPNFPLFDVTPCTTPGTCPVAGVGSAIFTGIGLNLSQEASNALAQINITLAAGTPVGIVKEITLVPEPATALLLGAGLSGLAWAGRRREA